MKKVKNYPFLSSFYLNIANKLSHKFSGCFAFFCFDYLVIDSSICGKRVSNFNFNLVCLDTLNNPH